MKVMTIQGSPRRQGNTATLLGLAEDFFRAEGHDVDRLEVVDTDFRGCCGAYQLHNSEGRVCHVQDEAPAIFHRMSQAEVILFASPVFCWGLPAQLKGLVDRLYCRMDRDEGPALPRLQGRIMGLLLTAGGHDEDNAGLVIRGFGNLVTRVRGNLAGHLFVPYCREPQGLDDGIKARTVSFAREMLERGAVLVPPS